MTSSLKMGHYLRTYLTPWTRDQCWTMATLSTTEVRSFPISSSFQSAKLSGICREAPMYMNFSLVFPHQYIYILVYVYAAAKSPVPASVQCNLLTYKRTPSIGEQCCPLHKYYCLSQQLGKRGQCWGASIPQEGLLWKQFKNVEPEMNLKTEKML